MSYKIAPSVMDTGTEFIVVATMRKYVPWRKPHQDIMRGAAIHLAETLAAEQIKKQRTAKSKTKGKRKGDALSRATIELEATWQTKHTIADAVTMIEAAWHARRALETRRNPSKYFAKLILTAKKYGATVLPHCDIDGVIAGIQFQSGSSDRSYLLH